MTDEAMNMAAEPAAAPEAIPTAQAEPSIDRSSEATPRSAIERAFAELDKQASPKPEAAQEPTTEAKPVEGDRPRTADGKFAPKDATTEAAPEVTEKQADKPDEVTSFTEPPKRFSADAKEAWKSAPEPVRAEITRAVGELEKGIDQYRQAFEPYREFDKKLREQGQDFQTVFSRYDNIERQLASNPLKGLDVICNNLGMSLRQVAERVMGQTPDQAAAGNEATIRELRNEINMLKSELGGVSTTIKTQSEQAIMKEIDAFAADNPRFDELANDISFFLSNGRANDLQEAYALAERLNPAPQAAPTQPAAPAAQPAEPAQPRKGNLSLSGAPSTGSNPANRKPPSSAREALDSAFARAGI